MSTALYNREILRLATEIPHLVRLHEPQGTAKKRSPVCDSEIAVDIAVDADGHVAQLGQDVRACALGQASAALMGRHVIGALPAQLCAARDALTDFLDGKRDDPGDWPGLEIFRPAIAYKARHASIRLAFEAAAEAALAADKKRSARG